jgi:hypothetical protein
MADRPVLEEVKEEARAEITPEMLAAARNALQPIDADILDLNTPEQVDKLLTAIYTEMRRASNRAA